MSEKYWLELGLATQQEYKVSVIQEGIYDAKRFYISWIYIKEKKKKVTRIMTDFYADLLVSIVALLIVSGTEILYVNHVADSLVLLLLGC